MKNFKSFLSEAEAKPKAVSNDAVRAFGRHNPGHLGHLRTIEAADKIASNVGDTSPGDLGLYTSRTQDPKKNPIPFETKLDHLKRMFPKYADKWDPDPEVKTVLDTAKKAHKEGYNNFHFVGGGDRQRDMENLLRKYNGNLYQFDKIYSHSGGNREENPKDPISSLSASKMRSLASKGNYDEFMSGLPIGKEYKESDAKELYNVLRSHMGVSEEWEIDSKSHYDILREQYVSGNLYQIGDIVESLSTGLVGEIIRCGANHIICVTEGGIMFRNFLHDVNRL